MAQEKGTAYDNRIIYTPSSFAKTNLLHLQETGTLQAREPHTNSRSDLNSYLFFMVIKGEGTLTYKKITFPLKKGDCVFIDCRFPYSHCSSDNLWELKWVHFYGPNIKSIYDKYMERGGEPTFVPKSDQVYLNILDDIFEIASSNHYIRDMQIFEKLTSLLTLLMSEGARAEHKNIKHSISANPQLIKDYIDGNFNKKINLDFLSEKFYINKFYLTRIFKEQFGVTPIEHLLRVRVTNAKILLRFTDMSIEKIGAECGIPDANYFARIFKKIEGSTPGDYRKKW